MMKKKAWMTAGIILGLALLAGVVLYISTRMTPKESWNLIYIPTAKEGTNDFWTSLISGTRMAAEEYGADLTVMSPEREQDTEQQVELFREAMGLRPDAILISPSVSTGNPYLEEARQRGIHIIYVDAVAEDPAPELIVSTDNLEVGRKLGEYTAKELKPEGRIVIVSQMKNSSTAEEREQGFREGLGELNNNVAEVVYCDSSFEKATDLTLKLIGVDSSLEAMELMEQGIFRCIVVQEAFKMGYLGVRETISLLSGKAHGLFVDSGCELVTKENMFDPRIEKLIFPFKEDS